MEIICARFILVTAMKFGTLERGKVMISSFMAQIKLYLAQCFAFGVSFASRTHETHTPSITWIISLA